MNRARVQCGVSREGACAELVASCVCVTGRMDELEVGKGTKVCESRQSGGGERGQTQVGIGEHD